MANDMLSGYSEADIKHFTKDFLEMVRVSSGLDRYFVKGEKDFDAYIKTFEKIVAEFNKKYKGVKLETRKKIDGYEMRVFAREKTQKMAEIKIDTKAVLNKNSAELKEIIFHGLKEGLNKKMNIHSRLVSFGFYNLLNEVEKKEWFEKFSPRFLE